MNRRTDLEFQRISAEAVGSGSFREIDWSVKACRLREASRKHAPPHETGRVIIVLLNVGGE